MYPRKGFRGNSRVIQLSPAHLIDVVELIAEVKKKPIIYDCRHDGYGDRLAKTKAWNEIGEAMIEDWDNMSSEMKETMEKSLRGKWRHIRDYFTKELKARKITAEGGIRKRKPYAYFKKLSFLLPVIEAKRRASLAKNLSDCKTEEVMCEEGRDSLDINYGCSPHTAASFLDPSNGPMDSDSNMIDPLCETSLGPFDSVPDVSSHNGQRPMLDEEDYEKMFLLSLLPSLRQVPENMKLQVKINIQQVIANALRTSNTRS
ncbi:uncharacterized protein [Fopius arisanus]|uniref:Uncharacterized protein n=1 Tax=Fopius arisanus TaxID=64838 RepID=A0A9R1U9H0_9HYME|nr:PREDICTED: uncharacterized protein LOC105273311 [Fopius arisanus]XP_011313976.1 PREDICTED: uncharacterized protein LOC105273311 [Fopius arisanus]XP_011313977.1 PREDICTED: uncharacterized protein LOC105273311 [Fopius arisanus]